MNTAVALTSLLIVLARITDVTLDTIRTVAIVQGRRMFAAILGFFQALVYVCAIAKVLLNMDKPAYALAYAVGFALGTYLGINCFCMVNDVRVARSGSTVATAVSPRVVQVG